MCLLCTLGTPISSQAKWNNLTSNLAELHAVIQLPHMCIRERLIHSCVPWSPEWVRSSCRNSALLWMSCLRHGLLIGPGSIEHWMQLKAGSVPAWGRRRWTTTPAQCLHGCRRSQTCRISGSTARARCHSCLAPPSPPLWPHRSPTEPWSPGPPMTRDDNNAVHVSIWIDWQCNGLGFVRRATVQAYASTAAEVSVKQLALDSGNPIDSWLGGAFVSL